MSPFSQLQQNADLNLPPPDWLRTNSPAVLFSQAQFTSERSKGDPSSVLLASHYPDYVGQVDVISDAKNIKKLLKMPYCPSGVSMAVHRVGNTLLIDELNAPLFFRGMSPLNLEKLFKEGELSELVFRKKDPAASRHRSMFSKLLYYSVQDNPSRAMLPTPDCPNEVGSLRKDEEEEERERGNSSHIEECSMDADLPGCVDVVTPAGHGSVGAISPAGHEDRLRHGPLAEEEVVTPAGVEVGGSHVTTEPEQSHGLVEGRGLDIEPLKGDGECVPCSPSVTDGGDGATSTPSDSGTLSPSGASREVKGDCTQEEGSTSPSTEQKDQRRVSLALVPLTETAHSFLTGTDLTGPPGNPLAGDMISPGELRSDVGSAASQPSGPAEEHLSEEHLSEEQSEEEPSGGVCGEGADEECNAGGVVLASHEEEEQSEEQQATFPCLPPEPPPQPFNLNMQWSIKDIRMLLGSDLPIFGSEGHPAISLRLRDMQKPITVLTGLDYWLDNLMCNVPELAMCFHLNGIVQRYEVIKTEDIPSLLDKNCQFSAPEVLEVAQNILAFLRANCTQEGHTYWLFRRKGEDAVKLYDLTPLGRPKDGSSSGQNLFAQSVAMLFYRVAQNLLSSGGDSPCREDLTIVKLLLENCIRLLGDERSQMVISAYYLLAQLFLSTTSSGSSSPSDHEEEGDGDREGDVGEREEKEGEKDDYSHGNEPTSRPSATTGVRKVSAADLKSLPVSALRQGSKSFPADPSLPLPLLRLGSSQDRARAALEYISKALGKLNVSQLTSSAGILWQATSGGHLLQLAGSAYFLLGDTTMGLGKLGRALRYTRYCIVCARASEKLGASPASETTGILFRAWQLCGDIHCFSTKLSESFSSQLEDFYLENPEDTPLITMATTLYHPDPGGKEDLCLTLHTDLETALLRSIDCYTFAQAAPPVPSSSLVAAQQQRSLCDRLGSAWNELGVYYMHVAASLDFASEPKQVEKLWTSSYSCLMEGLQRFQSAASAPNQALLYSNLGSLMRSCAQAHGSALDEGERRAEFTLQEKLYYGKAAEFYIQGKQALRRRSAHPTIWGNLVAELSAVYFTTGRLMQERAPLSTLTPQEVEREIVEVLMKALHQTEPELAHVDPASRSFVSLSQRAGDCHYRLASLYQKSAFTVSSSAQKQKQSRTQAEKHYSKALSFYMPKHHFRMILRVLLEKALLYEQQAQGRPHLRFLQNALKCLLECHKPLQEYPDCYEHEEGSPSDPLLPVLVHRLQAVLKQLVAVSMKKSDATLTSYKAMYAMVLRLPDARDQPNSELLPTLRQTLTSVNAVQHQI